MKMIKTTEPTPQRMAVRLALATGMLLFVIKVALSFGLSTANKSAIILLASVPALGLVVVETTIERKAARQGRRGYRSALWGVRGREERYVTKLHDELETLSKLPEQEVGESMWRTLRPEREDATTVRSELMALLESVNLEEFAAMLHLSVRTLTSYRDTMRSAISESQKDDAAMQLLNEIREAREKSERGRT